MKKTYKMLVILVAAAFALALTACGSSGEAPDAQGSQETNQQSSAPAEQSAPAKESSAKTGIDGNVYTNAEYGFTFTLPEGWSFGDEDGCAMFCSNEESENVAILTVDGVALSNEEIKGQLEDAVNSLSERSDIDQDSVEFKVDTINFLGRDVPYLTLFTKLNGQGVQMAQFAYSVEGEGTVFINLTGIHDGTLDTLYGSFQPL